MQDYPVFLYTGAKKPGGVQISASLSLGGFYSQNIIPNAQLFNVFSDVALLSEERYIVKCVVLANMTDKNGVAPQTFENIKMWFDNKSDEKFFELQMGVHQMSPTGEMQLLNSPYQMPYNIEFKPYYLNGNQPNDTNTALLGDLRPGEKLVIWWKRVTDRDAIAEYFKCNNIWNRYNKKYPNLAEWGYGEIDAMMLRDGEDSELPSDYQDFEKRSGININMLWDIKIKTKRLQVTKDSASDPNAYPIGDELDLKTTPESVGITGLDPFNIEVTKDF